MDMAKVISRRVVSMGRSFGPGNEARHELRCSVQVRLWCFHPMEEVGLVNPVCAVLTISFIYLLQLLPEMSAIIHERDVLEVENDRLHAILGLS
jgi:hypothetical protein